MNEDKYGGYNSSVVVGNGIVLSQHINAGVGMDWTVF